MKTEIEKGSNFVETLEGLSFGSSLMAIDQKFKKCIEASEKTGKVSTLTVTLKIKPSQGEAVQKFEIEDTAKANIPELSYGTTTVFKGEEGRVGFDHPEAAKKRKALEAAEARKAAKKGGHLKAEAS